MRWAPLHIWFVLGNPHEKSTPPPCRPLQADARLKPIYIISHYVKTFPAFSAAFCLLMERMKAASGARICPFWNGAALPPWTRRRRDAFSLSFCPCLLSLFLGLALLPPFLVLGGCLPVSSSLLFSLFLLFYNIYIYTRLLYIYYIIYIIIGVSLLLLLTFNWKRKKDI